MKNFYEMSKLLEMATGKFNWRNKPIGHINDFDKYQLNWIYEKMTSIDDNSKEFQKFKKFAADDGSGDLTKDQVVDALKIRLSGKKIAPTSVHEPIRIAGQSLQTKEKEKSGFGEVVRVREPLKYIQEFIKCDLEHESFQHSFDQQYGKDAKFLFDIMVKLYNFFKTNPHIFDRGGWLIAMGAKNYFHENIDEIDPEGWFILFQTNEMMMLDYIIKSSNNVGMVEVGLFDMHTYNKILYIEHRGYKSWPKNQK